MSMVNSALLISRDGDGGARGRRDDARQFALTEYHDKNGQWIAASVANEEIRGTAVEVTEDRATPLPAVVRETPGLPPTSVGFRSRVAKLLSPRVGTVGQR